MRNMLLYRGTQTVARERLGTVGTPDPTRTWTPIPHIDLLSTVEREVTHSGLAIASETFALSHAKNGRFGDRFFGLLEIQDDTADYSLIVGVRNSHDRAFPASLCVGARVFVCDNLSFLAQVVVARKHTRFIRRDLPRLIERAVERLPALGAKQQQRIAAYHDTQISDPQFHDLAIRAVDNDIISASKLPRLLSEFRSSPHLEFRPRTVWSAFNAFTEVLKHYNLQDVPKRTQALHTLCASLCHAD